MKKRSTRPCPTFFEEEFKLKKWRVLLVLSQQNEPFTSIAIFFCAVLNTWPMVLGRSPRCPIMEGQNILHYSIVVIQPFFRSSRNFFNIVPHSPSFFFVFDALFSLCNNSYIGTWWLNHFVPHLKIIFNDWNCMHLEVNLGNDLFEHP